jgi:uncharacterized repeat protein (TIGR01451 family)
MLPARTPVPALMLGTALAVMLSAAPAAADPRYDEVVRGGMTVTGNTLGLAKESNANGPGTQHSIGTFVAAGSTGADLSPVNSGNPWFAGTTSSWQDNASSATLALPAGATVTHAELVWGGSYQYAAEDVTAHLDTSVELAFGTQAAVAVAPDPATSSTLSEMASDSSQVRYYTRTADVTGYVAARGAGTYTVGHVPGTQSESVNTPNAAGWSLAVAYEAPGAARRRVTLDLSSQWVDDDAPLDLHLPSVCPPGSGADATVSLAVLEGDVSLTGDQVLTGPALDDLSALSGPNNPISNVFASQLNDGTGALDPSGTFGDRNHDASTGQPVAGGRQGTDVTTLAVPDALVGADDGLWVRLATTGDSFAPMLTAVSTLVDAPAVSTPGVTLVPGTVRSGGSATLTVPVTNAGEAAATGATMALPLPAGVTATRITVDGTPRPVAELAGGVALGTLAPGTTRTVRVTVTASGAAAKQLAPQLAYGYTDCAGNHELTTPATVRTLRLDVAAPVTRLTGKPKKRSTAKKVTFRFAADEAATFQCALDDKPFKPCISGTKVRVSVGKHRFRVRAVDAVGNVDATPAAYRFRRVAQD